MEFSEQKALNGKILTLKAQWDKLGSIIQSLPPATGAKMQPKREAIRAEIEAIRARLYAEPVTAPKVDMFLTPLPEQEWPPVDGSVGMPRLDPRPDLYEDSHLWNELLNMSKPCRSAYELVMQLRQSRVTMHRFSGRLWFSGPEAIRQRLFDPAAEFFKENGIFWDELKPQAGVEEDHERRLFGA